jgi:hypothetical protein
MQVVKGAVLGKLLNSSLIAAVAVAVDANACNMPAAPERSLLCSWDAPFSTVRMNRKPAGLGKGPVDCWLRVQCGLAIVELLWVKPQDQQSSNTQINHLCG